MPETNVFTAAQEHDATDPEGYRAGMALVGRTAGGRAQVVKATQRTS